jgi:hypothetical protein
MATKSTKKAPVEPVIDEKLYQKMREIYQEYTGQQVAAAVARIRREIELEREAASLDRDIERLVARRQASGQMGI